MSNRRSNPGALQRVRLIPLLLLVAGCSAAREVGGAALIGAAQGAVAGAPGLAVGAAVGATLGAAVGVAGVAVNAVVGPPRHIDVCTEDRDRSQNAPHLLAWCERHKEERLEAQQLFDRALIAGPCGRDRDKSKDTPEQRD